MKKRIPVCLLLFITAVIATKAETFTTENLSVFEILSSDDKTVSLIDINSTTSIYEMPTTVEYNGAKYTIVALGGDNLPDEQPRPALLQFTISENVTDINGNFFKPYTQLSQIKVDSNNKSFVDQEGVLYNAAKTAILNVPPKNTFFLSQSQTEYIVPANIQEIGNCAFCNTPLYYITISDNVKKIGDYAFCNTKLQNIHIPNTVESIGKGMLSDCENLKEVSFDKNSNITIIPDEFLLGSKMMSNIYLPGIITSIGAQAFQGLTYLSKIDFTATPGNAATTTPSYTFVFPNTVKSINEGAFKNCGKIEEFIAPESLEYLGEEAFANCESLQKAILSSNLKEYGSRVFYNDQNLSEISLPTDNAYIKVENGIWYDASKTKIIWCSPDFKDSEISVSEGITEIQDYAFEPYKFDDTRIFDKVKLPSTYKIMTSNALQGCVIYDIETSSSLQTIEDFAYNTRQTEITLPTSVSEINRWNLNNLETISLSPETTEISAGAFNLCGNLTEINLPAVQPPLLGRLAFYAMADEAGSTPEDFNPENGTEHNPIFPIPDFQYRRKAYIYVPAESLDNYLANEQWRYQTNPETCGPTGIVLRGVSDGVNVYVSENELLLDVKEAFQLAATTRITNNAEIISYKWESTDNAIASVSEDGDVKANAVGNCDIVYIAKATDGKEYKAACNVEVSDKSGVNGTYTNYNTMPDGIYTLSGIPLSVDYVNINTINPGAYIIVSNGKIIKIIK